MSSRHDLILKFFNVISFILVLVINFWHPKQHYDEEEKIILLAPTEWAFLIWPLIYTLLGGFLLYQWFPAGNDAAVDGVKWYFVVSNVFNISFILFWDKKFQPLQTLLLLALFVTVAKIYYNLSFYPPKNIFDRLFLHYPFAIYTAWTGFATVLIFWITFRSVLNTVLLSTIAIGVIGVITLYLVDYHDRRDFVLGSTVVWALSGIALYHQDQLEILLASSIAGGLIFGAILRVWVVQTVSWWRLRNQSLEESASLLGN